MAEKEADDDRIRGALKDTFDSGHSLMNAFIAMQYSEDGFEIEAALMGIPETVDGVVRDANYYIDRLRQQYVFMALKVLERQEEDYAGDRRIG